MGAGVGPRVRGEGQDPAAPPQGAARGVHQRHVHHARGVLGDVLRVWPGRYNLVRRVGSRRDASRGCAQRGEGRVIDRAFYLFWKCVFP